MAIKCFVTLNKEQCRKVEQEDHCEEYNELLKKNERTKSARPIGDETKKGNDYDALNKKDGKMTAVFNKLKVILWKNLIIRKRHWILTICEIAIPVVLFILISYARSKIEGIGKTYVNETTYNPAWPSKTFYHDRTKGDGIIFYTPENQFTNALIYKVQLKLNLNSAVVKGFSDEGDLVAYYEKFAQNESVMGVVFKGISNDEVPKKLHYSIRPYEMYEDWHTDKLFDSYMQYAPERGSQEYIYKGFIAMQMALDTSFIEMVSNQENLPFGLTMQEFPYPPYLEDRGITEMFSIILPLATVFSFVFLCPAVIKRIVEEKRTGIKELMKMMGLKSWMLWVGWFIHAFVVNFLSVLIITFVMKVPLWGAEYPAIEHCDASVFAIFLILYTGAGITFCFAISSLFSSPSIAVVIGILAWQLSYNIPSGIVDKAPNMNWGTKISFSLFPNMALHFGFQAISVYESREVGSSWSNLFSSASGGKNDVTMGNVFIMFIVDIILYTLIALYFERVRPGPYGLSKPVHFPIKFIIDKFKRKTTAQVKNQPQNTVEDYCKIEDAGNLKTGIEVSHLYKKYGSHVAVNDFSINIYQDQITALLGHNGAGKTTTMSIITGMIGASDGKITINGVNIQQNMDQVHGYLGVCPQHNLQFTDLTVLEHLMFFGMLKGLSQQKAEKEAQSLLESLNLTSKANYLASKLSGGMRRKLSLGITLMGDSTVLILDEPTSGLDPEARREIWDILLQFRGSRTIVITTHFMEEADVLGDRIAIMDHGRLICYGTSMYLKKEYGTGYHLTLICVPKMFDSSRGENQRDAITKIIQTIIPTAKLESEHSNQMTYLLPHEEKSSFGELLSHLETNKEKLAISNINVSFTTLEEVFLKVGNNMSEHDKLDKKSESSKTSNSFTEIKKLTGNKLLFQQLKILGNKRKLVTLRKWILFAIQFLIVSSLTFLTLWLGRIDEAKSENFAEFDMNLGKYDETGVFYNAQGANPSVNTMGQFYSSIVKQQKGVPHIVDDVSGAIVEKGIENIAYYKQHMIVAAEFNSTHNNLMVNAMYASKALHGAPISLNLVMNAVIKALMGDAYEISTSNNPLPMINANYFQSTAELQAVMLWFILFPLGFLFFSGTFLLFPQMEKSSSVKQMQIMCGLKEVWYWTTNFLFDLFLYIILLIVIVILVVCLGYPVYNGAQEIGALLSILFVYGLCVIPYCYLFSYNKTAAGGFASYLISGLFVSVVLMIIVLILEFSGDKHYENIGNILNYIFLLFPQYGLTYATVRFARRAIGNHNWNFDSIENRKSKCRFDYNPCCGDLNAAECKTYQSYFRGEDNISLCLLEMFCSAIFYFLIVIILETRFVKEKWNTIMDHLSNLKRKKNTHEPKTMDTVDGLRKDQVYLNDENSLLQVEKLQKKYGDHEVVKKISFDVNSGDCFGLLGVNGAGKTTTFRMLTGFELSTTGTVKIHEEGSKQILKIPDNMSEYLERVGYCPQFDAINEMLTGREMLNLFAELRGINGVDRDAEVEKWLARLDLTEYKDKLCGQYSGGNKRKLGVALALIGNPTLIMLDEPTSGVDPFSRRKLWNVMTHIKEQEAERKPSIILTSHSMEECEILCNKLTIMKKGRLKCTGTIPQLKEEYSQGFTVKLKLKIPVLTVVVNSTNEDSTSIASQSQPLNSPVTTSSANLKKDANEDIKNVKDDFESKYKSYFVLSDEHAGLLHYHLKNKNLEWGELFRYIEALKQKHSSIIEDYHISETTLEEVFLSVARADEE